jgi:hypothetical protein
MLRLSLGFRCIAPRSPGLLAQGFQIRGLCTSHRVIAGDPLVGIFLRVIGRVDFGILMVAPPEAANAAVRQMFLRLRGRIREAAAQHITDAGPRETAAVLLQNGQPRLSHSTHRCGDY